jgi:dUTP pyrophosphatase
MRRIFKHGFHCFYQSNLLPLLIIELTQDRMMPLTSLNVQITRLDPEKTGDVPLPSEMTDGSAGKDIRAAVDDDLVVAPGETVAVPTGFAIAVPEGYEAQVRPRSGLALKKNVGLLNSPGTIDSDYRGEVRVILTNFGKEDFVIQRGDRIAQLVIAPVVTVKWDVVDRLSDTNRGEGGFGSTGV